MILTSHVSKISFTILCTLVSGLSQQKLKFLYVSSFFASSTMLLVIASARRMAAAMLSRVINSFKILWNSSLRFYSSRFA